MHIISLAKIKLLWKTIRHHTPYVMVQTRMLNNKEYKCVVFNGKREYVAYNCNRSKDQDAYSEYPHKRILDFAESAVKVLAKNCPAAIVDTMVRVDVFQRANGKLVVNEFESFEADHHTSKGYSDNIKTHLEMKLDNVYINVLNTYLDARYFI